MEKSDEELVCSICDSPIKEEDEICYKCGSDLSEFEDDTLANNKYPSLKSLSSICNLLSFLIIIGSIASIYYGITMLGIDTTKAIGIFIIVYSIIIGILSVVVLRAISEGIIWMIDVENNSRVQTRLLYKLIKEKK